MPTTYFVDGDGTVPLESTHSGIVGGSGWQIHNVGHVGILQSRSVMNIVRRNLQLSCVWYGSWFAPSLAATIVWPVWSVATYYAWEYDWQVGTYNGVQYDLTMSYDCLTLSGQYGSSYNVSFTRVIGTVCGVGSSTTVGCQPQYVMLCSFGRWSPCLPANATAPTLSGERSGQWRGREAARHGSGAKAAVATASTSSSLLHHSLVLSKISFQSPRREVDFHIAT